MFRTRWTATLAASALVALTACAPPGADDEGGDEGGAIPIGVIADLTGATGDVGRLDAYRRKGFIVYRRSA